MLMEEWWKSKLWRFGITCYSPRLFKRFYLFLERGEGRETSVCERYRDQLSLLYPQLGTWPTTQACVLTGIRAGNLSFHRPALNPLSHTNQGTCCPHFYESSTELHWTNVMSVPLSWFYLFNQMENKLGGIPEFFICLCEL